MLMDVRDVLRQSTEKQRQNTCTLPTVTDSLWLRYGRAMAFQFNLLQNLTVLREM